MSPAPLVVSPDPEKLVVDYLLTLTEAAQPLEGWGIGTRTPENQTPDHYIQVRLVDGESPNALLYRGYVRLRVWDSSEYVAGRYARMILAYIRRALGARVTSLPVPLPDPVKASVNFYQSTILCPQIGESVP